MHLQMISVSKETERWSEIQDWSYGEGCLLKIQANTDMRALILRDLWGEIPQAQHNLCSLLTNGGEKEEYHSRLYIHLFSNNV